MVKLDQTWLKDNLNSCYNSDQQFLNLENKDFDEIDKDAFELKDITKLKTIILKRNRLTHFNFKVVKNLKELETLDLSNNQIDSLSINTSKDLVFFVTESYSLKKLYLNNNLINSIEKKNFYLNGMKDLNTIEIYNNNVREFDSALLKDLKQLKVLKLDYSKMKSFSLEKIPKFKVKINLMIKFSKSDSFFFMIIVIPKKN